MGYRDVESTGPLWPDASQYANAGAMIHDWLISGNVLRPYSFAKENYVQYPAFHIPYHPPVYPGMLGIFFLVTGVGFAAARFFIVLCLATAAWFFYKLLAERNLSKPASVAGALLLITIPEIAFWAGDTMSEIPSLALIICASYFFLTWVKTMQLRYFMAALCLAEAAFLSRYLSGGSACRMADVVIDIRELAPVDHEECGIGILGVRNSQCRLGTLCFKILQV